MLQQYQDAQGTGFYMVNWGCKAPEIKKRKKSGASKGNAIELTLGTLGGVPKGAFTGSTEKIRQVIIIAGVTQGPGLPPWPDSHFNFLLLNKPCWQARLAQSLLLGAAVLS